MIDLSTIHSEGPMNAIPTGFQSFDEILGIGGLPVGRVVEIYGPEASGKTTLMLHVVAETQRQGGVVAFIDAEHVLDANYAQGLGVNLSRMIVSQPDCGEQALEIAEVMARSGEVALVVVDSVAALTPRAEIEGEMDDAHVGLQTRLLSQALRQITAAANQTGTVVVFINQLRHKIGVMFGGPETTTGGNALKFYASVRVETKAIDDGQIKVRAAKNKMAAPFRSCVLCFQDGKLEEVPAEIELEEAR